MPQLPPRETLATHEVTNQPPPRRGTDLWGDDPVLQTHAGAAGADPETLAGFGETMGAGDMRAAARAANRQLPELRAFDGSGRRLDEVVYSPAYHLLMGAGIGAGCAAIGWEGGSGGHATHAAMLYQSAQIEPGISSALAMSYAAIPVLEVSDDVFARWVPKLMSRAYDPAVRPLAQKSGAMLSIATTEKQGGSDPGVTATRAVRDGMAYRLRGHKWFCSAPMADGFLTLAQASGGLTAFLVPRWLEDRRNGIELHRLKDKLGNRANASAEMELTDALAYPLGEEGAGLATLAAATPYARLDGALMAAGLMRAALSEAAHWAGHRRAAETVLSDQPLMRRVLADLALDAEGALALALYAARFLDTKGEAESAFARLVVTLGKYLNARLCPGVIAEAMEVMGAAGYVEESGMPLYFREAPVAAIWGGSGNMLCLEVLRILREMPLAGDVLSAELGAALGQVAAYDAALSAHIARFPRLAEPPEARWYAESLTTLLTASILIRYAPDAVGQAYAATRLGSGRGRSAGAIPSVDEAAILARLSAQ